MKRTVNEVIADAKRFRAALDSVRLRLQEATALLRDGCGCDVYPGQGHPKTCKRVVFLAGPVP